MSVDKLSLLERFCRYVRVNTQAIEGAMTYPSSPGQLVLGETLCEELRMLGLSEVEQSPHGIVYATVPATGRSEAPVVALFAHLDTSPETSGANVNPIVHHQYDGRDLVLPGDPSKVLRPSDHPELAQLVGQTIITSDGTTLLGADNKAGVAVIMETVRYLLAHPEIPHGKIRICFTCDEEIGHGTDHVDLKKLAAQVGYTLDGGGTGEIDGETFSADKATVTIIGVNLHPSVAKGKMVNAIRLMGIFLDRLPRISLSPETTDGRQGFLHPYQLEGNVAKASVGILLRDFETARLGQYAEMLRQIAQQLMLEYPQARIEVDVRPQYRNMAEGLVKEPRAVPLAIEAMRRAGLTPKVLSCRGGTDGSLLTAKGLPTPNLSTAEHIPHSPLEWTCLEEMETACRVLVELVQLWNQAA